MIPKRAYGLTLNPLAFMLEVEGQRMSNEMNVLLAAKQVLPHRELPLRRSTSRQRSSHFRPI